MTFVSNGCNIHLTLLFLRLGAWTSERERPFGRRLCAELGLRLANGPCRLLHVSRPATSDRISDTCSSALHTSLIVTTSVGLRAQLQIDQDAVAVDLARDETYFLLALLRFAVFYSVIYLHGGSMLASSYKVNMDLDLFCCSNFELRADLG